MLAQGNVLHVGPVLEHGSTSNWVIMVCDILAAPTPSLEYKSCCQLWSWEEVVGLMIEFHERLESTRKSLADW